MAEQTNIGWCDSTVNWWAGCTEVSPGCLHCYARDLNARKIGSRNEWAPGWGAGVPRHRFKFPGRSLTTLNRKPWICDWCGADFVRKPERCDYCRQLSFHPRRIFHNDLADCLDPEVSAGWFAEVLDGIWRATECTHILLTKRPQLWQRRMTDALPFLAGDAKQWAEQWLAENEPANVWLLATVEDQERAWERIPELLKIPAAVHGLSIEPLIGPIDLFHWCIEGGEGGLDWIIVGGESGQNRREMKLEWLEDIAAQADAAGVPLFAKQDSAFKPGQQGRIPNRLWARKEFPTFPKL